MEGGGGAEHFVRHALAAVPSTLSHISRVTSLGCIVLSVPPCQSLNLRISTFLLL